MTINDVFGIRDEHDAVDVDVYDDVEAQAMSESDSGAGVGLCDCDGHRGVSDVLCVINLVSQRASVVVLCVV